MTATKNNIDSFPVRSEVIEQIQSETGESIRFACRILRLKGFTCVLVSNYLKCSVGMDETNLLRMKQCICLLKSLV